MELVRARGGVDAAAALTGVSPQLLAAGVAYFNEHGAGSVSIPAREEPASVLQLLTQVVGLFAGVAAVVYLAGGVVLATRLAFEELPWEPVIGQLPREFVLSTGAGQVMLPAFAIAALYGLFRLLRGERADPPKAARWRDAKEPGQKVEWGRRRNVIAAYLIIAALLLVPCVIVLVSRELAEGGRDPDLTWLLAGYVFMLLPAIALSEMRAQLGASNDKPSWNRPRVGVAMAGVYALVTVPAFMAVGTAIPLTTAKVCASGDFEEEGALVGQAGDRVYLGEDTGSHRRLAVFPISQVEELFIGGRASTAHCDVGDARLAVVADERAAAAEMAADELDSLVRDSRRSSGDKLTALARGAQDAVRTGALAALATADAADQLGLRQAAHAREAGNDALEVWERLRDGIERYDDASKQQRAQLRAALVDSVTDAGSIGRAAGDAAREAADAARSEARRRQPSP